jgi:hypothetical protein
MGYTIPLHHEEAITPNFNMVSESVSICTIPSRQEEAGSHRYSVGTSFTGTPPAKSLLADSNLLSVILRFRPPTRPSVSVASPSENRATSKPARVLSTVNPRSISTKLAIT